MVVKVNTENEIIYMDDVMFVNEGRELVTVQTRDGVETEITDDFNQPTLSVYTDNGMLLTEPTVTA